MFWDHIFNSIRQNKIVTVCLRLYSANYNFISLFFVFSIFPDILVSGNIKIQSQLFFSESLQTADGKPLKY